MSNEPIITTDVFNAFTVLENFIKENDAFFDGYTYDDILEYLWDKRREKELTNK